MRVTEVAERVYLLDCSQDVPFSLSEIAYLLVDDASVLVEPGSTTTASALLRLCEDTRVDLRKVTHVIPTHIHVDHGGGSGYLAKHLPNAKVVVHPRGAAHMIEPSRLIGATGLVFGKDFEQTFGPIMAIDGDRLHEVKDGETLRLGRRDLTILHTPGHASHHISVWDNLTEGLFPGEALGYIATDMPDFPLPACVPPFDLPLYVQSIDRLASISPQIIFYSHCGARRNPKALISVVRENTLAFGKIVERALKDGKSQQEIWNLLSDYVRERQPQAELPPEFQLTVLAYLSYFSQQK